MRIDSSSTSHLAVCSRCTWRGGARRTREAAQAELAAHEAACHAASYQARNAAAMAARRRR